MKLIDRNTHGQPLQTSLAKRPDKSSVWSDLLTNKWVWIGAAGLFFLKGKCLLAGGAGLAAGYYLHGSMNTNDVL
jgi:hypothetical protein